MKSNKVSNKNNVIFFILLFLIPVLALDASFYFLNNINFEWEKKEQGKKALHEAEILASEADFSNQFSFYFKKYCDDVKNTVLSNAKDSVIRDLLGQKANNIFMAPFPEYNLYVFRIASETQSSEMLFAHGNNNTGKRGLCLAFEHLYNVAARIDVSPSKAKTNKSFANNLVGEYSDIETIAREMRGLPTYTNFHKIPNWFIWDYFEVPGKGVVGAIMTCDEVKNFEKIGRLLALKNLRLRGRATGAFIPIYKDFGEPIYQSPLGESKLFRDWSKNITIDKIENYDKWLKEDLPQGESLGNYTLFCSLAGGSSHVAVILVKAVKKLSWPKWLKAMNLLLFFFMVSVVFFGLCYKIWPPINLKTRFILSYILASILPLSLLTVTAYGYVLQYRNTSINKAISDLESALKSFDAQKIASVNEYKSVFAKAVNDQRFIELIKTKGIDDKLVAQRVVDIFENDEHTNPLPILGVKICDVAGNGAIAIGGAETFQNVEVLLDTCLSANINTLRNRILSDEPDAESWMGSESEKGRKNSNDVCDEAYKSVTGHSLGNALNKHGGIPIPRKNGYFTSYQIFDFIKIDGKVRYLLFVMWDDRTLDDRILQNAFDAYALKNLKQNFIGLRIKGQNVSPVGKMTRHATRQTINKATELAILVGNNKRISTYSDDKNLILAMPSGAFSETVFAGWIDLDDVISGVNIRWHYLAALLVMSLIILGICSKRSVGVFLQPTTELTKALDTVSNGNLNIALKSDSNDELGHLSEEFSGMIDGLREKERLSKLISDQAVKALEKHSDGLLNDTETFDGVALVSDIRNFTGISEANDPMVITDLLNEHFAEMTKVISDNGGLIYKFIGDAIEAVFPENKELTESASERAFKAGCMMISALAVINSKRKKRGVFTYRMGVGLCKGIMHSGSVGSMETRLDYAILGDPLKTAAKLEALSIQNPSFPLVVGENIADKIASHGFSFRKLDSKGEDFGAYTLEAIGDDNPEYNSQEKITAKKESPKEQPSKQINDEIKIFTLQKSTAVEEKKKTLWLNILIAFLIVAFVALGFNTIYITKFDAIKTESDLECSRLIEQLKCNDILKTSFEALCLDFFDETKIVIDNKKDGQTLSEMMKSVENHFEALKMPMPKYYCCKYDSWENNDLPDSNIAYNGFSDEFSKKISIISNILRNRNRGAYGDIESILGANTDYFNIRSSHYRRTALATVDGEEMFLDTDRFYYCGNNKFEYNPLPSEEKKPDFYGYVFCAMPPNITDDSKLINYYKILAGKDNLLAFHNGDDWIFSNDFPEKEYIFIKNNYKNTDLLREKGYITGKINVENKLWSIFAISRKAASYYYSLDTYNLIIIFIVIFIFAIIGLSYKTKMEFLGCSLPSKLRVDIITAAVLPLLIVCFVSHLYINEDYVVKKAEKRAELQNKLDELENKNNYYHPLCLEYIKRLSKSKELQQKVASVDNANNADEKKAAIESVKEYLDKNFYSTDKRYFKEEDPYFNFNEAILLSKKGWAVTKKDDDENIAEDGLESFGRMFSEALKITHFDFYKNSKDKDAVKSEMVLEGMSTILSSNFGSNTLRKFFNFPDNPVILSVAYATVGVYLMPFPSMNNPDFIVLLIVDFDNELLLEYCDRKNNKDIDINSHIASGSVDSKIFLHTSPNVDMGRFLYKTINENRKSLKELLLASHWTYSGKLPVSRTIDLNGDHYLEARPGNIIGDTVFLAFTSGKPIQQGINDTIIKIVAVIALSVFLIFFIVNSIISDLLSPIKRLMVGAQFASRGDYSFRTDFHRSDELGALCNSFDKMMKGLEEKQLMNRMVSKTALNVSSSQTDASSKRVNAFLLYVAVPGFNKIMKNTNPYELFVKLRAQIATIAEIVLNAGGDIDKIMGEKLLIAFQVLDKNPEEIAKHVCEAARAIETSEKLSYEVAVGVNFGQVISGFLGVGEKRDFTVIGDPVNVAARIASLAEKQTSERRMISEPVMKLAGEAIKSKEFGKVSLKGKSELLSVYQLV